MGLLQREPCKGPLNGIGCSASGHSLNVIIALRDKNAVDLSEDFLLYA